MIEISELGGFPPNVVTEPVTLDDIMININRNNHNNNNNKGE